MYGLTVNRIMSLSGHPLIINNKMVEKKSKKAKRAYSFIRDFRVPRAKSEMAMNTRQDISTFHGTASDLTNFLSHFKKIKCALKIEDLKKCQ